jgi:hypothetical protein
MPKSTNDEWLARAALGAAVTVATWIVLPMPSAWAQASEGERPAGSTEGAAAPGGADAANKDKPEGDQAGGASADRGAGEARPEGAAAGGKSKAGAGKASKAEDKTKARAGAAKQQADAGEAAAEPQGDAGEAPAQRWVDQVHLSLGPFTFTPMVLVGVQVAPYAGDESLVQAGDVVERPGFRLRHARLGLAGAYEDLARFAVSMQLAADGDGAKISLRDAWAGYTQWSFLRAFVGARSVPFSRSALVGSGNGALIERPLVVRAMAPFHQIGAELDGDPWDGAFGYSAGVYNGFQRSDQFYSGYVENFSPLGNRFDGMAFAARLRSEPIGRLGPTVADEEQGPFRFGVGASYFYSHSGARDLHSAAGDALMKVAGFHLLAEALWSLSVPQAEPTVPTTGLEQVTSFGLVAEAGYMIIQDAFGLTARFEWIDPNTNTDDEGDNWLLTAGAGYQLLERLLKVQAEYTHREELHGLSLANDSVLVQFQLQLDPVKSTEESL